MRGGNKYLVRVYWGDFSRRGCGVGGMNKFSVGEGGLPPIHPVGKTLRSGILQVVLSVNLVKLAIKCF